MATTARARAQDDRLRAIGEMAEGFRSRRRSYDDEAAFPAENFDELRAAGLLALTVPDEYGGDGLWWGTKFVDYYETLERLAWADSSTAQLLQVHSHATGILARLATPAQRDLFLPDLVKHGQLVASVGSESAPRVSSSGTYVSELTDGPQGLRLTCRKHFASLAPAAHYLLIWVAVPGSGSYEERTVTILVPREAPEVELIDEWDVLGMRSTVSWGVQITDYQIPANAVIGEPGAWVKRDPRTFTLGFAANHVGAATAAFDLCCDWVRERPHLSGSELVQAAIGELSTQVYGARQALYAAARTWETGDYDRAELESLQALSLARHACIDVTRRAFEVCGARSIFRFLPLEQMYRDARAFTLHTRDDAIMRQAGKGVIERSFFAKGFGPIRQA